MTFGYKFTYEINQETNPSESKETTDFHQGKSLFEQKKYPEAVVHFQNALEQITIDSIQYETVILLSRALISLNHIDSAQNYLNQYPIQYDATSYWSNHFVLLQAFCKYLKYNNSIEFIEVLNPILLSAKKNLNKVRFQKLYIQVSMILGEVYRSIAQFDEALNVLKAASEYVNKNDLNKITLYNRIGAVLQEMGHGEEALIYQKKSLEISLSIKDTVLSTRTMVDIGYAFLNSETKDLDSAYQYFNRAVELSSLKTPFGIYAHLGLARCYQHLGQHKKAIGLGQQALIQANNLNINAYIFDSYDLLANSFNQLKKHDSAYHYLSEYMNLFEEKFNIDKNKQIEDLKAEYNFNLVELEKNNALLKLEKNKRKRQIYVVLLVFLSLLILLIIWAYWKQKVLIRRLSSKNQIIQNQNNKLELLNKEIYHRTKNHFQAMGSLLGLQKYQLADPQARRLIEDNESRMHTMSLLHKKLFYSNGIYTVEVEEYFKELIDDLVFTYHAKAQLEKRIHIDNVSIDLDTLVNLAIIANECLSNALKYGLNSENPILSFEIIEKGNYLKVKIADNGTGFSDLHRLNTSQTFGLELIKTMIKHINGSVEFMNNDGAVVLISVPIEVAKSKDSVSSI